MLDNNEKELLYAGTFTFLISFILHAPSPISGPTHYSDILSLWNREMLYVASTGKLGIPYAHIFFEYPPVIASIYFLATLIPYTLFGLEGLQSMILYFIIMSLFEYLAYIGLIHETYKLSKHLEIENQRLWKFMIIPPTIIFYLIYNWDIIAIYFAILAINAYLENNIKTSGIFTGLAVASKLIPGLIAIPILLEIKNKPKQITTYITIATLTYLALDIPFALMTNTTWIGNALIGFLTPAPSEYFLEDTWMTYIFMNYHQNQYVPYITLTIFTILALLTLKQTTNLQPQKRLIYRSALLISTFLFSSPVYPPQMNLMIIPLFTLIPTINWKHYMTLDILNVAIITTWFTSPSLSQFLGLGEKQPLEPFSPSSIIATTRDIILLIIILTQLIYHTKHSK